MVTGNSHQHFVQLVPVLIEFWEINIIVHTRKGLDKCQDVIDVKYIVETGDYCRYHDFKHGVRGR